VGIAPSASAGAPYGNCLTVPVSTVGCQRRLLSAIHIDNAVETADTDRQRNIIVSCMLDAPSRQALVWMMNWRI